MDYVDADLKHYLWAYDLIHMPVAGDADVLKDRAGRVGPDSDGPVGDGPEKDRRRSARFTCGGDAKISRLPSDGIFLPGKVLDLSLHGCRVDTPFPIDCGVRAEIVLRVNASSFRAVGEVRAIRDGLGTGIEFVQLSANGKDMLADLVRELAKLQAAMNKLKSVRRETDAKSFRLQLEEGRLQAARLSKGFAALGTVLSKENLRESSELNQSCSADRDGSGEADPLVVAVDLFG
jgi:hypothetical protein